MKFQHSGQAVAAMMLAFVMLAGCKSKEDAAIEKAKQQAAATGQAQQVVSTDKNGNVTTTTVQPPAPGQTAQAVTTTVGRNGPGPNSPGWLSRSTTSSMLLPSSRKESGRLPSR